MANQTPFCAIGTLHPARATASQALSSRSLCPPRKPGCTAGRILAPCSLLLPHWSFLTLSDDQDTGGLTAKNALSRIPSTPSLSPKNLRLGGDVIPIHVVLPWLTTKGGSLNGSDLMAGTLKSGGLSLAGGRKRTWRYSGLLVRWGWGTEQKNANRLRVETGQSMTDS